MSTQLEAALRYAELGYPVFPCVPGGKAPMTLHGYMDATTDPERIQAWWDEHPEANIGMPTQGLLAVDVDGPDNPWPADAGRLANLEAAPTSLTPRGGRHHIFRQPEDRTWRSTAGRLAPHVDTRADGGYIVLPPSVVDGKPYRWVDGKELGPPDLLLEPPAWLADLLEIPARPVAALDPPRAPVGADPPEDGNVIPTGQRNATLARLAGVMRRYGMSRDEILPALIQTNQGRCRPPLSVREVERIAASISRYEPDQVSVAVVEDHWGQDADAVEPMADAEATPDPGLMPDELFRVPGFISEVMDHSLLTAPYPNQVMAFAGALCLQAFLAGRKVRDPGDNRTNIYLLGLAYSAAGKDRPRKVNSQILGAVGLSNCLGSRFASGEGIQDALLSDPAMLFQTDEIDGMLQSINKARDARHENLMSTMLTIYSSSDTVFPLRRRAGLESPGTIDQPCLVVFGTAIPTHYYQALSERMLTNGFFSRMIVLECAKRQPGQEPKIRRVPDRVIATAKWWAEFRPGTGNLQDWHPEPWIVPQTRQAREIMVATRLEAEQEYARAEAVQDEAGTTVWGRVSEHVRKLALLYAISENHAEPEIGLDAASWARRFVMHQARRMLFMARSHVSENPFDAECLKFLKKLRGAPDGELAHSVLLKRMKTDAKTFHAIVTTLEQRRDILTRTTVTRGAPGRFYRLTGRGGQLEVAPPGRSETGWPEIGADGCVRVG